MFAKRGLRDKPEGGVFHARDNDGTDRTPDHPAVHTDSSRRTESKTVQGKFDDLSKKMLDFKDTKKMEHSIDYQENQSRRCNLRFDGVSEVDGETWEQTEKNVRRATTTALELPEAQVYCMCREPNTSFSKFNDNLSFLLYHWCLYRSKNSFRNR